MPNLNCPNERCGYTWFYTGARQYTSCPRCRTTLSVKKNTVKKEKTKYKTDRADENFIELKDVSFSPDDTTGQISINFADTHMIMYIPKKVASAIGQISEILDTAEHCGFYINWDWKYIGVGPAEKSGSVFRFGERPNR